MTIVVPNVEPHNDYNVMLNSISNPNYFVYSRAIAICLAPPNALARGAWERYR